MTNALLAATGGGSAAKTYVDDVFSAFTYTGTSAAQSIVNGLDLAGKGGMVWTKARNNTYSNFLVDTARGLGATASLLCPEVVNAPAATTSLTATSTGYDIGASAGSETNLTGTTYGSLTFLKRAKFFDIVTYTGDGTASRAIPHNLGAEVGMAIVRCTSIAGAWAVYHRSLGTGKWIALNEAAAAYTNAVAFPSVNSATFTPTATPGSFSFNQTGQTYVAYFFAHDASTDGIIQCGSYVGDGSNTKVVNLGWEPQLVFIKCTTTATDNWQIYDTARGMAADTYGAQSKFLSPNLSSAENSGLTGFCGLSAIGFMPLSNSATNATGETYIYMAIRRSNKPPTSGNQVYYGLNHTGIGSGGHVISSVPFAPDMLLSANKTGGLNQSPSLVDRMRGINNLLQTGSAGNTGSTSNDTISSWLRSGVTLGADSFYSFGINASTNTTIKWFFKRAANFFDIVVDTGTGVTKTVNHNLLVTPELIIRRSVNTGQWDVFHSSLANTEKLLLNSTAAKVTDASAWNSTSPSATSFTVGAGTTNASAVRFVSYLFSTLLGVSKVGSYIGNNSTQDIDCGFAGGARFILIRPIDTAGSWNVWDTTRGIVAGIDQYVRLDAVGANQTTLDTIDPYAQGFTVNQDAANMNVTGTTYIFLAIA